MITVVDLRSMIVLLGQQAVEDIVWSETVKAPETAEDFAWEAIYVICNSGMKNTIARQIYDRIRAAIERGDSASTAFRHDGKSGAIDEIWRRREYLFKRFLRAQSDGEKLAELAALPWIGGITKFHLAKNFGVDCAKPDVHLQRLADREGTTPQALCERLARDTGYRVATVDLILWRACATGVLNSRTGALRSDPLPLSA